MALLVALWLALTPAAPALPCAPAQLKGTFTEIPGSGGLGHISYSLRLRNRSAKACTVAGFAGLRLLGKTGKPLPTNVTREQAGLGLVRVVIRPGKTAKAEARFSPTVPSTGEPVDRQCEPTAYRVRVTLPQGGTLIAPISPPTPFCGHGGMLLKAFRAA